MFGQGLFPLLCKFMPKFTSLPYGIKTAASPLSEFAVDAAGTEWSAEVARHHSAFRKREQGWLARTALQNSLELLPNLVRLLAKTIKIIMSPSTKKHLRLLTLTWAICWSSNSPQILDTHTSAVFLQIFEVPGV